MSLRCRLITLLAILLCVLIIFFWSIMLALSHLGATHLVVEAGTLMHASCWNTFRILAVNLGRYVIKVPWWIFDTLIVKKVVKSSGAGRNLVKVALARVPPCRFPGCCRMFAQVQTLQKCVFGEWCYSSDLNHSKVIWLFTTNHQTAQGPGYRKSWCVVLEHSS